MGQVWRARKIEKEAESEREREEGGTGGGDREKITQERVEGRWPRDSRERHWTQRTGN